MNVTSFVKWFVVLGLALFFGSACIAGVYEGIRGTPEPTPTVTKTVEPSPKQTIVPLVPKPATTSAPAPKPVVTSSAPVVTKAPVKKAVPTTQAPAPVVSKKAVPPVDTDGQFSSCKAVKAAGLGPYYTGDKEYSWYEDRDNDGVVCE